MFKHSEKRINIVGYSTDNEITEKIFSATFRCCNCKHIPNCDNIRNCTFVKYIQDRVTESAYECNSVNPQLIIILNNKAARDAAIQTIIRAKRLRSCK